MARAAEARGIWVICKVSPYTRHRFRTVRPYEYRDAATLMADFWTQVAAVLKERGVES
jgi:hypothetical protein